MNSVKVVGIGGSMKPGSASLLTLRLALDGAEAAGATTELFDILELDLPIYRPDLVPPPAVHRLISAVAAAGPQVPAV